MIDASKPQTYRLRSWNWGAWLKKLVYLLVLLLVVIFLADLGAAPWRHALTNWPVLLILILSTGGGLMIQAQAFRSVSVGAAAPFLDTAFIWSVSAVVSVIAPLFAGIATRTTLLVRAGMSVSNCLVASLRQVWMGVEYALLLAVFSLPFTGWLYADLAVAGALLFWVLMRQLRRRAGTQNDEFSGRRFRRLLHALHQPVPVKAHLWFVLQVVAMSLTFYVGFNGLGADFGVMQAVALAALTVLLSLIVFVPNGLGVTDVIWVYIASRAGLTLEESVAIAIVLRLGHLSAGLLLWSILALWPRFFGGNR